MAVFRVEKNKGYTVMSNHHLRNKELSLKAKGLLSQMLSLPEDWDYTLAGLSLINREKIDAIREAVRELENAGYIQRSRERDEKGRLRGTTKALYPQADCFPQRKGGGSKRTAGESQKQRQGDCKMNAINWKKRILPNIPYLLFVYLFDKVGQAVRLAPGADFSGKVLSLGEGFSMAFANPLPSLAPMDLLIGIFGAVLIRLIVYVKGKNAKKYRKGVEYGSARWGTAEDIKPYTDPVFQNNVLLTQTERLTMNSRPKQPKYARNKNILVIGGSGSGKTRFFVKPNLMQMHSSYVVTDPKGTVLVECGKLLQRGGYRIKVLNTINFKKSMKYNPFAYLRSEKDILKLVNTLIANTKGDGEKAGEDFWVKSERLFYCALIGYIRN